MLTINNKQDIEGINWRLYMKTWESRGGSTLKIHEGGRRAHTCSESNCLRLRDPVAGMTI